MPRLRGAIARDPLSWCCLSPSCLVSVGKRFEAVIERGDRGWHNEVQHETD